MKAQTKNILVALALCLSGGLVAMNSISVSSLGSTGAASSQDPEIAAASADRFASHSDYCQAFFAAHNVGSDGVSAEFSMALGDVIQANGGDVKRSFASIGEKCKAVV